MLKNQGVWPKSSTSKFYNLIVVILLHLISFILLVDKKSLFMTERNSLKKYFKSKNASLYEKGIRELVFRWEKIIEKKW